MTFYQCSVQVLCGLRCKSEEKPNKSTLHIQGWQTSNNWQWKTQGLEILDSWHKQLQPNIRAMEAFVALMERWRRKDSLKGACLNPTTACAQGQLALNHPSHSEFPSQEASFREDLSLKKAILSYPMIRLSISHTQLDIFERQRLWQADSPCSLETDMEDQDLSAP